MESFADRLLMFIKDLGMSQNEFEKKCKLTHTDIRAKKQGPTAAYLMKICTTYPNLNMNWLISGVGNRYLSSGENTQPSGNTLPLIPIEAFAGPGMPTYEDERIEDYYTVTDFKQSDFLIRVKGDSMSPRYTGGSLVACKKVSLDKVYFLQWGRVYVVYTESQGVMIKRIEQSEKEGYIKCVSENTKYAPFDVPMNDVVSIALVNGAITLE